MKAFEYLSASSFDAASAALAKSGVAKSGGTDLLDLMKERVLEPTTLVNLLGAVPKLADGDVSALTTLADLAADARIKAQFPALAHAAGEAATPQIRNRATVGGNLCQTSRCGYLRTKGFDCFKVDGAPCAALQDGAHTRNHAIFPFPLCACAHPSNLAPALIAVKGKLVCSHPDGERVIDAEALYQPPEPGVLGDTTLRKGELIAGLRLEPSALAKNSTYVELRERQSFDFAIVSVAAAVHIEGGKVKEARIVCGAVASTPYRAKKAEAALVGKALNAESIAGAAKAGVAGAKPLGGNAHKVVILQRLIERALGELK